MPARKQTHKRRSSTQPNGTTARRKRKPAQNTKAFASYVKSEMERQKLNGAQIEERAKKRGGNIDRSTVSRVLNCLVPEISTRTVKALAAALNQPSTKLLEKLYSEIETIDERVTIEITLPGSLHARLDDESRLNRRDINAQLEALLAYYYNGEQVNISTKQLDKIRHLQNGEEDSRAELSPEELAKLEEQVKAMGHKYYGIFADDPGALEVFDEIERLRDQHTIGG